MADWLNTPAIVLAVLAVAGALVAIGRWMGKVDSDRSGFRRFTREIREVVMPEIRRDIKRIFERLPAPITEEKSPLQLTDKGEQIADFLKARDWAAEVAPPLAGRISGKEPFEVDQFAERYVAETVSSGGWRRRLAACAYEFGRQRSEIPLVLRIALREELLRLTESPPTSIRA